MRLALVMISSAVSRCTHLFVAGLHIMDNFFFWMNFSKILKDEV